MNQNILKTTVSFDHPVTAPKDVLTTFQQPVGKFVARVIFDNGPQGQEEQPSIETPADKPSFEVEAPEGQVVVLLIAYEDERGVVSPATPLQFTVDKVAPPARPTNVRVTRVVPVLKVLGSEPAAPPPTMENQYLISVEGHLHLADGSIGRITEDIQEGVEAEFDRASLRPGCDVADPLRYVFVSVLPDDITVTVITPEQKTIPFAQYIAERDAARLAVAV